MHGCAACSIKTANLGTCLTSSSTYKTIANINGFKGATAHGSLRIKNGNQRFVSGLVFNLRTNVPPVFSTVLGGDFDVGIGNTTDGPNSVIFKPPSRGDVVVGTVNQDPKEGFAFCYNADDTKAKINKILLRAGTTAPYTYIIGIGIGCL